jgi:parallel beta-helix repeat protein
MRRLAAVLTGGLIVALGVAAPGAHASVGELVVTGNTTLTEDHHGPVVIAANGVTLNCAGHTIDGSGSSRNGVEIVGRDGVTVTNCRVVGFGGYGIVSSAATSPTVGNVLSDNVVIGNGNSGIALHSVNGATVTNNVSADNGSHGYEISDSNANVFAGNVAKGNSAVGFAAEGSDRNTLTGNRSIANLWGFALDASDVNTIEENASLQNDGNGFILGEGSSQNRIAGNRIQGNGEHGLLLIEAPGNSVLQNTSIANGAIGIGVQSADNNELSRNLARMNFEGILIEQSVGTVVLDNTAVENTNTGFWVRDGAMGTLVRGNTSRSNASGIIVWDTNGSTFERNLVAENRGSGIGLLRSNDNLIRGNTASRNATFGILLEQSLGNVIDLNTANGNGVAGIAAISGSNDNTFTRNVARNNTVVDAAQLDTVGNVWTNNNFGTTFGI